MIAILKCASCGAPLSGPIRIFSTKDPATSKPQIDDQKPITTSGEAIKSWRPIMPSFYGEKNANLETTPQYWLNPVDTAMAVERVKDSRKLSGCCGLDGRAGPNMRCKACKTEVGTRLNACYTSDVFIPDPIATEWTRLDQ
jgi:hypothetical protein